MNFHIPTFASAVMVAVALPALVAAALAISCRILAQLSGWARLSEVYAIGMMPRGRRFAFQSAVVGNIFYMHCLEIHTAAEGIYMRLPFGLNLGHRLLMIPWADLRQRRQVAGRGQRIVCEIGYGLPITIELPGKILAGSERSAHCDSSRAAHA